MLKIILSLLLVPSAVFSQGLDGGEKEFLYPEFTQCGLVTKWSSAKIPPNCLQTSLNVLFDEDLSVYRRNGYTVYNTVPCSDLKSIKGMWAFNSPDGQRFMVINSSQSFFYSKWDGLCTSISGLSGFNTVENFECTQTLGKLWCTNGVDTPFYWDGISTKSITGMPIGDKIGNFRNRVVISGVSGELSRIRLSGEGNGEDWTLVIPGRSTSPSSIDISGTNDGERIKAIMGTYQNSLLIGRENDIWGLYGNDRRDFTLRQINNQIGIIDGRTSQEKDNSIVWMSRRGLEKMSGATIERISDPIRDITDDIVNNSANQRSKSYTSQEQWEAGLADSSLNQEGPLSTSIYPGSVVPSTWSHVETEGIDWSTGTQSNTSTSTSPGYLEIGYEDFEDLNYTANPVWTNTSTASVAFLSGIAYTNQTGLIGTGLRMFSTSTAIVGTFTFDYKIASESPSFKFISTGTWSSVAQGSGYYITLEYYNVGAASTTIKKNIGGSITTLCTMGQVPNNSTGTININRTNEGIFTMTQSEAVPVSTSCTFTDLALTTSSFAGFMSVPLNNGFGNFKFIKKSTASWVSPIFDTTFSTPTGGPFSRTDLAPTGSTITYSLRQSTASAMGDNPSYSAIGSTQSYRIPFTKRYWQYKADFSTDYSTQTPQIDEVGLQATATGYYIADCVNTTGMTSWGNFRPVTAIVGGGAISYWTTSGTSCNQVTRDTATWTVQTANSVVAVATNTYLGIKVYESPYTSSDTTRLDAITVDWKEGNGIPVMASVVFKDRYYLFYTTSVVQTAYNNNTIIYDRNDKFTLFDGINAGAAVVYDNKLYTGDSQNTGYIYQQSTGTTDNGGNYSFKIKTSDYDYGNPVVKKLLKRVYLTLKSETQGQNIDLTVKCYINGSTTAYSLNSVGLDEADESGYFVAKFPVSIEQEIAFNWLSFEIEYAGGQGPLSLYSIRSVYKSLRWE